MSDASTNTAASAQRPGLLGMRHIALYVPAARFDSTVAFYRDAMGLGVDWQPDADNVYLSSGRDNVAVHRVERAIDTKASQLDHLGFLVPRVEDVAAWYARLAPDADRLDIEILTPVKTHRDGATSFYLLDPARTKVQIIHIPSIAD